MGVCDICHNRAWLEAFRDNLCLQIIRPVLPTYASIQFDTRRQRSSDVVRMVVYCEHPKMIILAMLPNLRTNNLASALRLPLRLHWQRAFIVLAYHRWPQYCFVCCVALGTRGVALLPPDTLAPGPEPVHIKVDHRR